MDFVSECYVAHCLLDVECWMLDVLSVYRCKGDYAARDLGGGALVPLDYERRKQVKVVSFLSLILPFFIG